MGGPPSWHRTSRRTWCLEAIWDSLVSFPPKSLSLKKVCLGLAFLKKSPQKKPLDFFHNTNQPPAGTRHLRLLASTWQAQLLEIWHWHCWNKTGRFDGWNEKKKGRCTFGTCKIWDGNSYMHKWFEFVVNVRRYCIYVAYRTYKKRTWKTGEKGFQKWRNFMEKWHGNLTCFWHLLHPWRRHDHVAASSWTSRAQLRLVWPEGLCSSKKGMELSRLHLSQNIHFVHKILDGSLQIFNVVSQPSDLVDDILMSHLQLVHLIG